LIALILKFLHDCVDLIQCAGEGVGDAAARLLRVSVGNDD
jgi:hypothetical protein